jgi:hypothetical protein
MTETDDEPTVEPTVSHNSSFSSLIPTLQIAHDSTSTGEAQLCWWKYKTSIIDGYEPNDTNVHFYFGHEYHHSLEFYDHLRAEGLNYHDSVHEVVSDLLIRTWDKNLSRPWPSENIYKNRGTLLRSVIWYLAHFEHDPLETMILPSGKPATELHFDIDIGYVSRLTGESFRLVGHIDRIALFEDQPVINDRKTTRFQITESFFDRFTPDNQIDTYLFGGNSFMPQESPVLSMIIDAAQILVNSTKFHRGLVSRTPSQLEEWIADTFLLFEELERRVESNHWPRNRKACGLPHTDPKTGETRYGCPFRDVCAADPSMRELLLKANFSHRTWDPSKPRELERTS